MRLSQQLFLIIALLFVLVFVGALSANIVNTRNYINKSLEFHAQDTATSLGLTLTHYVKKDDLPAMNSMVDAVFDRGYFQKIVVTKTTGEDLVKRDIKVIVKGVPSWFMSLLPLETPEATATVMAGWKQLATVHVRSHPGYAYNELWNATKATGVWLLIAGVIAFILAAILLRMILAPLKQVENQALSISNREFPVLPNLPWTIELRHVVIAMNKMTTKVQDMLNSQTELTEKMRSLAYEDEVTGLYNRRNFEERLNHIVNNPDEFSFGALFLIQIADFKNFNEKHGYEAGDTLLGNAATLIKDAVGNDDRMLLARLSGADFAILGQNLPLEDAEFLASSLSQSFTRLSVDQNMATTNIGVAYIEPGQSPEHFLSLADAALRAAESQGENSWHVQKASESGGVNLGATQWREALQDVLKTRQIFLYAQPVYACQDKALHHIELLPRIQTHPDTPPVSAGIFIPVAEHYGMVHDVDKMVVEKAIEHVKSLSEDIHFAVNLSPSSILDSAFIKWLCNTLATSTIATQLIVETSETGTVADLDALTRAVNSIRETGCRFSIDHFGSSSTSFGYIKSLKVDYIKVDGSYISNINENEDSQFFISSLAKIAHGLEIQIIAEFVETREELDILKSLGIDAAQGYLLGVPQEDMPPQSFDCD
ncbi:MAG: LapD/MoxY N-terminal periplasmic domain-containing protein [Gammaproteobacteria bacterium]|nr:MAG: LapD/MoxY N-terminal periplasmic domain-containing protein [Gammaproteobacteria bacterium]